MIILNKFQAIVDFHGLNKAVLKHHQHLAFSGWFKKVDFSEHLTSENLPRCDIIRAYKSFIKNLGLG